MIHSTTVRTASGTPYRCSICTTRSTTTAGAASSSSTQVRDGYTQYMVSENESQKLSALHTSQQRRKDNLLSTYIQTASVAPGQSLSGFVEVKAPKRATFHVVITLQGIDYELIW